MLWQLDFARVFREKGGFDIVIGNPPYGIVFDTEIKPIYEKLYHTFKRNNDMYVAFYQKSLEILENKGILTLITPNTFLNGDYFKQLRTLLKQNSVIEITDFKNNSIFADPTVYVAIGIYKKEKSSYPQKYTLRIAKNGITDFEVFKEDIESSDDAPFKARNVLFDKIEKESDFILIDEFDVRDIGFNYWSKGSGKQRSQNSVGARVLYSGAKQHPDDIPYLKGRDINRFYKGKPTNYLRHDYEAYLNPEDTFRFTPEVMENPNKIIYRQTANKIIATFDSEGMYNDKTIHCIVPKSNWSGMPIKYLLALLNSKLFEYLYREISQETEGRAFAQVKTVYIKQLPIKRAELKTEQELIKIVYEILENVGIDGTYPIPLQEKLDKEVYKIYNLSDEEIAIVEASQNVG